MLAPFRKIRNAFRRLCYLFLDDFSYAKVRYRHLVGRELNLENPRYFSEKLQVLKLRLENINHHNLVDKYEVRSFIKEKIGEEYLNELYFVVDSADEVREDMLPDSFVIKATHGSGFNFICKDRKTLDFPKLKRTMKKWLRTDFYRIKRELPYKLAKPRIVCERYLKDESGALWDYKFFCFRGEPKFIQVDIDRQILHKRALYDVDWNQLPEQYERFPVVKTPIKRPETLEKMTELARIISRDFPFLRVDFYTTEGRVVFGELTLYPSAGFGEFIRDEDSLKYGDMIKLT